MPVIVAIGGSAGGLAALRTVLAGLPADFAAPVCAVLHIGRYPSRLPQLLAGSSRLPVGFASAGLALVPGHVYLAPPDHHLIADERRVTLSRGPRENFARPAIDPLFRSAARAFGRGAIGVVLSGRLNDGTPGLHEIKQQGGVAVVEDPGTAEYADMPRSALEHVDVDHCVPAAEIAPLLVALAHELATRGAASNEEYDEDAMSTARTIVRPVALICPECGGAMRRAQVGTLSQYECHIGHRFTTETLAAAQLAKVEENVETVLRELNERAEICRTLAEQAAAVNDAERRRAWEAAADEAGRRLRAVRDLFDDGWPPT